MSAHSHTAPDHPRDPWGWIVALTAIFAALVAVRLTIPTDVFFDEVHYVPAARELLAMDSAINKEHPMLGKSLIALGMLIFGDNPLGWRVMPAAYGVLALFAALRAMWLATADRFATLAAGAVSDTGKRIAERKQDRDCDRNQDGNQDGNQRMEIRLAGALRSVSRCWPPPGWELNCHPNCHPNCASLPS